MGFKRYFIIPFLLPALFSCSGDTAGQSITKLQAYPFISTLYGDSTKTLALAAEPGTHIAWMGLDWSADYKFFKVNEVMVNGLVIPAELDSSQALFKDITLLPPNLSGTANSQSQFHVKLTYSPLAAISAETTPHKAYLLITYDKPEIKTVRVELTGYTRGICNEDSGEKCNFTDTGDLTPVSYHLVDNKLDVYTCHPQVSIDGIDNDPDHPNTRHDEVTVTDPFVFYVTGDGTLAHIVRNNGSGQDPSVPRIDISLPPESSIPIKDLYAEMVDVQNVQCEIDAEGGFQCEEKVKEILLGIVEVSLEVTTGTIEPQSSQCDFGTVSGQPGLAEDQNQMTVVAWGVIENTLAEPYNGAVLVVKLVLQKD